MVNGWQESFDCVHTHVGECLFGALQPQSLSFYPPTRYAERTTLEEETALRRSGDGSLLPGSPQSFVPLSAAFSLLPSWKLNLEGFGKVGG